MEILRTDLERFKEIKDYPYDANYVDFDGIRMHYLDEGEGETILALHGEPSWSYLYRKFIPVLNHYRFIAPDMIGFGKSDKLVGLDSYSFDLHYKSLVHFIEKLELSNITLIVQDWGGLLGLSILGEFPKKFKRVVILNTFLPIGKPLNAFFKTWVAYARYHPALPIGKIIQRASYTKLSKEVIAAYDAPFPSQKYKDGARSFPSLVPSKPSDQGVKQMKRARQVLADWKKPALVMFSDKDKILSGFEKFFYKLMPSANKHNEIVIQDAGHFLQEEKGVEIATYVDQFIRGELAV